MTHSGKSTNSMHEPIPPEEKAPAAAAGLAVLVLASAFALTVCFAEA